MPGFSPCDICLERKCLATGGPGTCKCETCDKREACPRRLRPTIRITQKCTQKCAHCCFESGPERTEHMAPAMAAKVAQFIKSNGIDRLNVMGGEFFCNPDWDEVLTTLFTSTEHARLVSNGDWAGSAKSRKQVIDFLASHDNIHVALSFDKWHTNKHVETAMKACADAGIPHVWADREDDTGSVPVGRHQFEASDSPYGMFSCWCHKPDRKYTFLVDEEGLISKCPFGMWTYDRIGLYLDGGFRERFKQFHGAFYETFVPSCHRCEMSWQNAKIKMLHNAKE